MRLVRLPLYGSRRRIAPHSLSDVRCRPVQTPRRRPGKLRPSNAMKPAAAKPGEAGAPMWELPPRRGHGNPRRPQNLGRQARRCGPVAPQPEPDAMETSDARKTWGGRRADVNFPPRQVHGNRAPAKPGETGAPMWGTPAP